jgi:hypothetical protein
MKLVFEKKTERCRSKISAFETQIACPCGPSIQTVSVKKKLELSVKCVKKYLIKFVSNFSSIHEKIQTP